MYSEKDVIKEVQTMIQTTLGRKVEVRAEWLSQAVISMHPGIEGKDKDFYLVCTFGQIRGLVRTEIRKQKLSEFGDGEEQPKLPGFEYVQMRYSIVRNGEPCIVPIERMTKEEVIQKARDLEKMQQTLRLHSAELWRYLAWREQHEGEGA
jgi:hypothetical protein